MANKRIFNSLQRSSDFVNLKKKGRKFIPCYWITIFYGKNDKDIFRIGWTVSRFVGNAVLRNRLKRWSREYFRNALQNGELNSGMDINVIFRPSKDEFYKNLSHNDLDKQLSKFAEKIIFKNKPYNE